MERKVLAEPSLSQVFQLLVENLSLLHTQALALPLTARNYTVGQIGLNTMIAQYVIYDTPIKTQAPRHWVFSFTYTKLYQLWFGLYRDIVLIRDP